MSIRHAIVLYENRVSVVLLVYGYEIIWLVCKSQTTRILERILGILFNDKLSIGL